MTSLSAMECPICRDHLLPSLTAPERMFGLGGEWHYGECRGCGSLHLVNPPADLSPYYPHNYYSMELPPNHPLPTGIRKALWRWRNQGQLTQRGMAGVIARLRPRPDTVRVLDELRDIQDLPSLNTRILDIGCGHGEWLHAARQAGFTQLHGCDPFAVPLDRSPIRIFACEPSELTGPYDLIRLSHSLEHMPDQFAPMRAIARLLAPGGRCIIAIPVAQSAARDEYGPQLIGLDPPRHFVLHTEASLSHLADAVGLRVASASHENTPLDFWGSELYRRGMTLMQPDGPVRDPREIFSPGEMQEFEAKARHAQQTKRGAQMRFVLTAA